jgi:hypothetical protein
MTRDPQQPPPAPAAGPAKPGPEEPRSIAASILPQRKRDAARHPPDKLPAEQVQGLNDVAAAEQAAVETGASDDDDGE